MLSKEELTRTIISYEKEGRRVRIMNYLEHVLIRLCTENLTN